MAAADVQPQRKSGWERAVAKFGAAFQEQGLSAADIPAAIVVHEARALVTCCQLGRRFWLPLATAERLRPVFSSSSPVRLQVVGLAMAAGFWSACYAVQPSKTVARPLVDAVARSKRGAAAQAAYGAALAQATRTVARLPWLNRVRGGCVFLLSVFACVCIDGGGGEGEGEGLQPSC